jgi:signal peptidase I
MGNEECTVQRQSRPALHAPLRFLVGVVVALILAESWYVQWCVVPSGSMAETLLGVHGHAECPDCGQPFDYGTDVGDVEGRQLVCPNCGYVERISDAPPELSGDRLLVHKAAFDFRPPRRWEVVAFRSPQRAGELVVKRVVGLPGETIEIRGGDVFANGTIQRKTLAEQLALAIRVHDNRYRPKPPTGLRPRWEADQQPTRWQALDDRFQISGTTGHGEGEASPPDWLTYHHTRRIPGQTNESEESPVSDGYGYNQTQPVRDSHEMRDLLLTCQFRCGEYGRLLLLATDGETQFLVRFSPSRQAAELLRDGQPAATAPLALATGEDHRLAMSLVDRQYLLAIDGQPTFGLPFEGHAAEPASTRPFAIGSQGLGLEVWDLEVFRDVYYTEPPLPPTRTGGLGVRLAPDEYYVLGDNSPQSLDSRYPGRAVPAKLLVGKPLIVYFPSRLWTCAGMRIQVPDLSRIRYIR